MDNIVIIGGDKRQEALVRILRKVGYRCRHISSAGDIHRQDFINKGDVIILPVPVSKDGEYIYSSDSGLKIKISDILGKADSSNSVFGGNVSQAVKAYLAEKNIGCFDYLGCEELTAYNAYLTGLGAVRLLYENTDEDLKGKKVLITGYGRVARFTAREMLKAGCDVYVSARKDLQLTQAECEGCKVIEFDKMSSFLYLFDFIINTVPENIFFGEDVGHIKGKYVELASAPYGVSRELFVGKEEKYIFGGSLPGRYLPCSAAEKLAEITLRHINMRNGGD